MIRLIKYSSMCEEMRQFFGIAASTATLLSGVDTKPDSLLLHFSSQELFIIVSQIRSFVVSALGFRKKFLSVFASFVDVTMTFIQGLDVFLCGLYEACDLIEAVERRRQLQMRNAFPTMFNVMVKSSLEGLQSVELLSWCCREVSPMPLPLKAAIVKRQLTSGDDPKCNLREQEREILSDVALGLLLEANQQKSVSSTATRSAKDPIYVLALLWLRQVLVGVRQFDPALHSSTIDSDLFLLEDISSKIVAESDSVLDVYRSSSCAQFRRAAEILKPLEERTRIILERFPEVTIYLI
ncbi:unnamed protein product [Haemonchus placei]|uniref:Uncharacterized protein n=1 Tax=Haemonchus placei TaxID=6290 RepID=A0A0N4WKH7_HAEPC|nr:unnamed protein product [Haemonchus placei]